MQFPTFPIGSLGDAEKRDQWRLVVSCTSAIATCLLFHLAHYLFGALGLYWLVFILTFGLVWKLT